MSSSSSRTKFEWSPLKASRISALVEQELRQRLLARAPRMQREKASWSTTHSYASGILRSEKRRL